MNPYRPTAPSPILQELLNLGVLRADSENKQILLPSGVTMGKPKAVVNNQASASYTIPESTDYVGFTGTQQASLTINFPAASAGNDGRVIVIYTQAAVGTALTLASAGATFNNAPATLTAGQVIRYIYDHATLKWLPT